MQNENLLKDVIYAFHVADDMNNFSFTSGHLGAVLIDDVTLKKVSLENNCVSNIHRFNYFFYELIKLLLSMVMPIKNVGIVFRTILRNLLNSNDQSNLHNVAVISLGSGVGDKDAYFGPLLVSLKDKYSYFKIVGGQNFFSKNYTYIESLLTGADLFKFSFFALFSPIVFFGYAIRGTHKIRGFKLRMAYLILALRDINLGVAVQNYLINKAILSLLNSRDYKFKKVIYPMEGRSWEKKIVKSFDAFSIASIGYIHCALTPRHLSLIHNGFYEKSEVPSLIITPSEMIFRLITNSFKDVLIRQAFFLRGSGVQLSGESVISPSKILFALTGNQSQSRKIMRCVADSKILKKYDVVIGLNKNTSTYKDLSVYAKSLGLTLYSGAKFTNHLPAICFFRSSSVALEYLRYNCIPVYLSFEGEVSANVFDLDQKIDCSIVSVGDNFESDIQRALSKSNNFGNFINGYAMSEYYLRQNYNKTDLAKLID